MASKMRHRKPVWPATGRYVHGAYVSDYSHGYSVARKDQRRGDTVDPSRQFVTATVPVLRGCGDPLYATTTPDGIRLTDREQMLARKYRTAPSRVAISQVPEFWRGYNKKQAASDRERRYVQQMNLLRSICKEEGVDIETVLGHDKGPQKNRLLWRRSKRNRGKPMGYQMGR